MTSVKFNTPNSKVLRNALLTRVTVAAALTSPTAYTQMVNNSSAYAYPKKDATKLSAGTRFAYSATPTLQVPSLPCKDNWRSKNPSSGEPNLKRKCS